MAGDVEFRRATRRDVASVVSLLAEDAFGTERERADLSAYLTAFDEIDDDPRHLLVVGEHQGQVVACLQATLLPCLTHGGRRRAQFEGVRVGDGFRGRGVGSELLGWAIDWARRNGAGVVQLTTDKRRTDARRFYEATGFVATHEGMKLALDPTS